MRDKDAGDLFGIRAIEAGYFGGVAQSANNSPNLTPRGSVGDLSPTFSGPQYSRSASSASASNVLDFNRYGRSPIAESDDSFSSSQHRSQLRLPLSPTIPSIAYAVRKTPSPTKSPLISPASSPIQVPSMAHIRQIALRPSTAERTGRHSHIPPIELPVDLRLKIPSAPLDHPDLADRTQPPLPDNSNRHSNIDTSQTELSAVPLITLCDDDNEAPKLLLPDFIGSSELLMPDFDEPRPNRASTTNISKTSAQKKTGSHAASPTETQTIELPTITAKAKFEQISSKGQEIVSEKLSELPASSTSSSRAPIPSLIVERGRFYFDCSSMYCIHFRLNVRLTNSLPTEPLTLTLPVRSPLRLSPASSKVNLKVNSEKEPRVSEELDENEEEFVPRNFLALALPTRSPLRLSPASSKSNLKSTPEKEPQLSAGLDENDEDNSPRTSFSFDRTLSEYRRESMIIPPSPPRKYRIGDTPMSSLTPHAMTTPFQNTFYMASDFPDRSSRRMGTVLQNHHAY